MKPSVSLTQWFWTWFLLYVRSAKDLDRRCFLYGRLVDLRSELVSETCAFHLDFNVILLDLTACVVVELRTAFKPLNLWKWHCFVDAGNQQKWLRCISWMPYPTFLQSAVQEPPQKCWKDIIFDLQPVGEDALLGCMDESSWNFFSRWFSKALSPLSRREVVLCLIQEVFYEGKLFLLDVPRPGGVLQLSLSLARVEARLNSGETTCLTLRAIVLGDKKNGAAWSQLIIYDDENWAVLNDTLVDD